ncbi:MAG: DUF3787 domain-containing protein [Oscillospiraceae bacterium]|nr:DUF3787 domain-containing protein [Oscillospiraceae bacterium]
MQDKKNKTGKKKSKETGAFETFALAGGKKNPKNGTTIPSEEGVIVAKEFIEENKK